MNTLILTQEFSPHKVLTWDRAILMVFQGKVEVVEEYDEVLSVLDPSRAKDFPHVAKAYGQRFSPGDQIVIRTPSVLRLWRPVGRMKRGVKFSRVNVFTRDGFRCCYCGFKGGLKELNYDHLVPRHLGGKTVWENIVTSCYPCNARKGHKTLEHVGMKLLRKPYKPKTLPMVGPRFDFQNINPLWMPYMSSWTSEPAVEVA